MAFLVEDGTGIAGATAYCTVAFVDAYFVDSNITTWVGDVRKKEQAIIKATRYIERHYIRKFRGYRAAGPDDQGLSWPRGDATDDGNYQFGNDAVPPPLQEACAELALLSMSGKLDPNPVIDATAAGVLTHKKTKVGPITTEKTYSNTGGQTPKYPEVQRLMRMVTYRGSRVDRA